MVLEEFSRYIKDIKDRLFPENMLTKVYNIFVDKFGEDKVDIIRGQDINWQKFYEYLYEMSYADYTYDTRLKVDILSYPRETSGIITRYYSRNFRLWTKEELDLLPDSLWKRLFVFVSLGVDQSRHYITVKFPYVTVSNELGQSTNIKGLYMRTGLTIFGTHTCKLEGIRNIYTRKQIDAGYIHSHLNVLDRTRPSEFKYFCTGSGPINAVELSLYCEYNEVDWQIYCYELNRLVSVESIAGMPYIRLDSMKKESRRVYMDKFNCISSSIQYKEFLKYFLKNKAIDIKFNYTGGHYDLNVNLVKFAIDVSRCYEDFMQDSHNRETIRGRFDNVQVLVNNNKLYLKDNYARSSFRNFVNRFNNAFLFTFKGKNVNLVIEDIEESADNEVTIISQTLINTIYTDLIILANNGEIIRKNLAANEQAEGII